MQSSLNHIYRLVWNAAQCRFVPVPETARGCGKGGRSASRAAAAALATVAMAATSLSPAWAQLPTGGDVVGGSGSIATQGNTMTVTQTTDRMAANWQTFSIGKDHTVNFVQPSSSSVALNRVLGSDVSVIQGAINANGKVFLVNPNGVLFTKDAQVDVGSMVASTLNISTTDFMAGNYRFEGASSSAIVNQGRITAHGNGAGGGTVAMIAAKITNEGSIAAHAGNVLMGAGSKVLLDLGGPVKIQVEQGAIDALIEQGGAIKADGGLVYLSAKAAGDLVSTVINHTGMTEAQTLATGETGQIYLMGGMQKDRIEVAGKLDASALKGGDGGFIETSAANVQIQPGLVVTTKAENGQTGEWLIDPTDIYIVAGADDSSLSGTPATNDNSSDLASSNIHNQTINTALASTNVNITTASGGSGAGDIFVNAGLEWSSGYTLTLNANRNIEINATIDASQGHGGKLVLEYGQGMVAAGPTSNNLNLATYTINAPVKLKAGQNFSTKLGSDGAVFDYTVITGTNAEMISELQAINTDATTLAGNYAISGNVDLTGVAWTPIGTNTSNKFIGSFDGLGHTISNLLINDSNATNQGLFGVVGAPSLTNDRIIYAQINNLKLDNFSITAKDYIGSLLGQNLSGSLAISNVKVSNATLTASATNSYIGGLVGRYGGNWDNSNRMQNVAVEADINGYSFMGGLFGFASRVRVYDVAADVNINILGDGVNIGGLVGSSNSGSAFLNRASSNGTISGNGNVSNIGGLTGLAYNSQVSASYSNMVINTPNAKKVGGLVGHYRDFNAIINSYFAGNVVGDDSVGGLVGHLQGNVGNTISTSYSRGAVSGNFNVGGLIGLDDRSGAQISSSFYDKTIATGMHDDAQNWAKTTAEMQTASTYSGWNTTTWLYGNPGQAVAGYGIGNIYPVLKNVTPADEIVGSYTTLFDGGWGGLTSSQQTSANGSAYVITTAGQLQNINQVANQRFKYVLFSNIDLAGIIWVPIGNTATNFAGVLDGNNKIISNLAINTISDYQGLFGAIGNNVIVSNLTLANVNISAGSQVGGLAGSISGAGTVIENVSVSGAILSDNVTNSASGAGGLVGFNAGTIRNSSSSVSVTGSLQAGGLVGFNSGLGAKIETSYATGAVTANGISDDFPVAGGLVGKNELGTIINSYATGDVIVTSGENDTAGGLVGQTALGSITNSYAIGSVNATTKGGLIGSNNVGAPTTVTNSFFDKTLNPGQNDEVIYGRTTAQMQEIALYDGWDIDVGQSLEVNYPQLTMFPTGAVWKIRKVAPAPVAPAPVAPVANDRTQQAIQSVQSILNSAVIGSQGTSGLTGNTGPSSNSLLSAGSTGSGIQSLNTPAASVAANVGGGSAVPAAPASVSVSGGLAFVSLPAEPSDTSEGAASPAQQAALSNDAAGRDTSGFMRVFVVQGGINLPEQASSTAEQNTGGNQ